MLRRIDTTAHVRHFEPWRRQLGECLGLPALAVTLPWPLAWRALRALATRGHGFGDETTQALAIGAQLGFVAAPTSWALRHRLTRMIDQIDPALSATRGDGWMDRHLAVSGDALPRAPCVVVGFHYGTGFWSLRHLRRHGHRVSFVSAPIDTAQWREEPLRLAFARWRQRRVASAGGAPVIYVGGSVEKIRAALREGTSVLALIDVPEATTSPVRVRLLGHDVWLPDGILRIAAAEGVPLIGFVGSFDARTGARRLCFTRLPGDPDTALDALTALLEGALRDDPAGWHFWSQWPRFRAAAAPG
ncbi:MAG: hypothetical protein ACM3JC_14580 [Rudaea sp.]